MYLEKLEIQGLKSFANRNILKFPGFLDGNKRGLTAVVGPNGSGKSNVADAIRWALGEQSMKTLRGKKAEDIIFSGTEKRGKLGMAEVSLFLNNSDKGKKKDHLLVKAEEVIESEKSENEEGEESKKTPVKRAQEKEKEEFNLSPLDLSEIVITRRLYRNGDSEYMINNQRVRLADVQMFLAKAKFGQKTYSVIGQGTVEGFLNTTMSERKEFFDEATGVKQFQMKRDESLNKLRNSYENLIQAQMLITEIEPRLRSLTRQVNRLNKREELEKSLKEIQLKFYSKLWHDNNNKFKEYNEKFLELEGEKRLKDKKLDGLSRQMSEMEKNSRASDEFSDLQAKISQIQSEKDSENNKLIRIEAQLEMNLEAQGKFDLSFLMGKKEELKKESDKNSEEMSALKNNLEAHQERHKEFENNLKIVNNDLSILNDKFYSLNQVAENDEEKHFGQELEHILKKLKQIKTEDDITRLKKLLKDVEGLLEELIVKEASFHQNSAEQAPIVKVNKEWQEVQKQVQEKTEEKEEILGKRNDNNLRMSAIGERIKLLKERSLGIDAETIKIKDKLRQNSGEIDLTEIENKKSVILKKLDKVNENLREASESFSSLNKEEEEKKTKMFALQKDLQAMQSELNVSNNHLNDVRVSAARFETKLEDLEVEIRDEIDDLRLVKDTSSDEMLDMDKSKSKIMDTKRQLDLIGGIDPQVESEYTETKERYDFLSGQIEDFNSTVKTMEKIIKELDHAIKDKFDKEFVSIARNFEKYFKILFNGGKAKLIKVMEDVKKKHDKEFGEEEGASKKKDLGEMQIADLKKVKFLQKHNATGLQGVEIEASPPGKKISSVAMLSGGERALTAIALICAIISANPSPFVVLDEVDAALDEANSERLARILDELAHKTQFIVITHNRALMRRANILYGVTMGDDGVSKLLSVKLDEAVATTGR